MNTVQKIQKDKIVNETLFYSDKPKRAKKMAKFYKMAKCVFSWPAHFKNGQIFRNGQSGNPVALPALPAKCLSRQSLPVLIIFSASEVVPAIRFWYTAQFNLESFEADS